MTKLHINVPIYTLNAYMCCIHNDNGFSTSRNLFLLPVNIQRKTDVGVTFTDPDDENVHVIMTSGFMGFVHLLTIIETCTHMSYMYTTCSYMSEAIIVRCFVKQHLL